MWPFLALKGCFKRVLGPYLQRNLVSELIQYKNIFRIINLHILEDLARIIIKTGDLKLSFYFLQINEMTSSNIHILKKVILTF